MSDQSTTPTIKELEAPVAEGTTPKARPEAKEKEKDNQQTGKPTLLQTIIETHEKNRTKEQIQSTVAVLESFLKKRQNLLEQAEAGSTAEYAGSLREQIHEEINNIDAYLSQQLDRVIHHPRFQRVEATWRGLRRLISESEDDPRLIKFRLINTTRNELMKDLRDPKLENTDLFNKIHERGFGRFGGDPYGVLLLDFSFTQSQADMALLTKLGQLGAVSHAPVIASVDPEMFGLSDYSDLETAAQLKFIMNGPAYSHWQAFRVHPNSRYVGLLLPRTLLRYPHGDAGIARAAKESSPTFVYSERVAGPDNKRFLWGSPIWAYGECLTASFFRYGWCSAIQGAEGGGDVELPRFEFPDHPERTVGPCEVAIPDSREHDFSENGFIALVSEEGKPKAVFFSGQSAQKPQQYYEKEATASAELSAELPNVFAVARFAHYIKVMLRKKVGQFTSPAACQKFLRSGSRTIS